MRRLGFCLKNNPFGYKIFEIADSKYLMVFFEFEIFIINLLKRKFSFPVILWYPTISGIGFIVLEKFLTNLKLFIDKKDLINQVDPDLGY